MRKELFFTIGKLFFAELFFALRDPQSQSGKEDENGIARSAMSKE